MSFSEETIESLMSIKNLYIIAILEGIVSLGIEVTAFRQITPFCGSSLELTTLILSSFLIALAFGYKKGSNINNGEQDNRKSYLILKRNFLIVLFTAPISLSYLIMNVWFNIDFNIWILFGVWVFVSVVVPVYYLGQTLPILSSLSSFKSHAEASGTVMYYSTIGSVIGAVGVTAVLFNLIGVSYTIFVLSLLIVVMILIIDAHISRAKIAKKLFNFQTLVIAVIIYFNFLLSYNTNFISQNAYANVEVIELKNNSRVMKINGNFSSFMGANSEPFPYIENFRKFTEATMKKDDESKILILGAGGFSFTNNYETFNTTYVDVNADLISSSEEYFLKDKINGKVIIDDARRYLLDNDEKYEIIILDLFTAKNEVPAHLVTLEFLKNVKEHLKPDGSILINIIVNPFFKDNYSIVLKNTINKGIGGCTYVVKNMEDKLTNVFVRCNPTQNNEVFSDNLNRSSLYMSQKQ